MEKKGRWIIQEHTSKTEIRRTQTHTLFCPKHRSFHMPMDNSEHKTVVV